MLYVFKKTKKIFALSKEKKYLNKSIFCQLCGHEVSHQRVPGMQKYIPVTEASGRLLNSETQLLACLGFSAHYYDLFLFSPSSALKVI